MNVLIFSGTADGRRLSRHLADRGADVTVCVATEYGSEEQGEYAGIRVLAGRLDAEGMKALLPGFALCIDATHPYALRVSENLRAACGAVPAASARRLRRRGRGHCLRCGGGGGIPLPYRGENFAGHRLKGPGCIPGPGSRAALSARAACTGLPGRLRGGRDPAPEHHRHAGALFPRTERGADPAVRHRLGGDEGRGHGGRLSREGSRGTRAAARETGAGLIVLRRPEEDGESFEEIAAACEELMKCRST